MKVLVTGGAGFIGSHLVKRLIRENYDVVVLDNLTNGDKSRLPAEAKFIEGDVRDPDDVRLSINGCEAVFHLAAMIEVRSNDADMDYKVNYLGSKNVAEIAKQKGVRSIFTSSAAVYGESAVPCTEQQELKPISDYGKNKLKAEKFFENGFVARLFNVYGNGGSGVVAKFCSLMPKYEPVAIFGRGTQTRDFVHVDDVVRALILGLGNTGLYNVGTGVETSVLDIYKIIKDITKSTAEAKFDFPNDKDIRRSVANISKIKSLGWQPKHDIVSGITALLKDIDAVLPDGFR